MRHTPLLTALLLPALCLAALPGHAATSAGELPVVANGRLAPLAPGGPLDAEVGRLVAAAEEPRWIGYAVDEVEGRAFHCCWHEGRDGGLCELESGELRRGSARLDAEPPAEGRLMVLLRAEGGRVERVNAFSLGCPLDAGGRQVFWLGPADDAPSIGLLSALLRERMPEPVARHALAAVALHRSALADDVLSDLAAPGSLPAAEAEEEADEPWSAFRQEVYFWLGQTRGRRGVENLRRATEPTNPAAARLQALMPLAESDEPDAAARLDELARTDPDPRVRGHALLWLSRADATLARAAIEAALAEERPEVRRQALVALIELDRAAARTTLSRLARESDDPELRRHALMLLLHLERSEAAN